MTRILALAALLGGLCLATPGWAKKYRYQGGPEPAADTALSVAVPELETVVRARGPRVPLTNLQILTLVANAAFENGLERAPLSKDDEVLLAPAGDHPLNFVAEHAVLRALGKKGVTAVVRHTPLPDDSLSVYPPGQQILEYRMASARVTYLRLRGWLPGRVKIERQGLVEARLALREPERTIVRWSGDATHNLVDAFPRNQLSLVEDDRVADLKAAVPGRAVDKVMEPIIVVAIVGGLIALFFQNRP